MFWNITCTLFRACYNYYEFFSHLLTWEDPDCHQNLISSFLYYPRSLHKISLQSMHNFLSNVPYKQTNKQTNQCYQKHNLLCQGGNENTGVIQFNVSSHTWVLVICGHLSRYFTHSECVVQLAWADFTKFVHQIGTYIYTFIFNSQAVKIRTTWHVTTWKHSFLSLNIWSPPKFPQSALNCCYFLLSVLLCLLSFLFYLISMFCMRTGLLCVIKLVNRRILFQWNNW